jgi:hypothetical protein
LIANIATPVTLPPGRARLSASPLATGSSPMKDITIGTVEDASLTARIATVETAMTTSGLVAIASRASSGRRAGTPACVVNVRLRPTTKPSRASSGSCKLRIDSTAASEGEITAMR